MTIAATELTPQPTNTEPVRAFSPDDHYPKLGAQHDEHVHDFYELRNTDEQPDDLLRMRRP
jgi:hypothetical protein